MAYEMAVRETPALKLYAVRMRARQSELGPKIGAGLAKAAAAAQAQNVKPGAAVVLYHNSAERNMMSEGGGDVDIGFLVEADPAPRDDARVVTITSARCLTTTHVGPYDGLPAAHAAIHRHAGAEGLRITGMDWEDYGIDPDMSQPAKLVTRIYYKLA